MANYEIVFENDSTQIENYFSCWKGIDYWFQGTSNYESILVYYSVLTTNLLFIPTHEYIISSHLYVSIIIPIAFAVYTNVSLKLNEFYIMCVSRQEYINSDIKLKLHSIAYTRAYIFI